eukprot:scaffold17803_cov13-Tisochrysis_lutea.AAC.1
MHAAIPNTTKAPSRDQISFMVTVALSTTLKKVEEEALSRERSGAKRRMACKWGRAWVPTSTLHGSRKRKAARSWGST